MKKLYKDRKNAKLSGVCAGIAKYFDLDPTVIRILWVVITMFGGSGIIAYIVCAFIMPEEPPHGAKEVEFEEVGDDEND